MPTANDENQEIAVPTHPYLEVVSVCTQVFNKCMLPATLDCLLSHSDRAIGSRRLITYRRIPDKEVDPEAMKAREVATPVGKSADELNPFRKAYFNKFETADGNSDDAS